MEVRKKLRPGDRGTKRLVQQYGEQLVCVRYRYDKKLKKRFTTIELIIDDKPWIQGLDTRNLFKSAYSTSPEQVLVRITYEETDLRQKAKSAGGRWQQDEKAWLLGYETAIALGLEKRIIKFIDKADA